MYGINYLHQMVDIMVGFMVASIGFGWGLEPLLPDNLQPELISASSH